MTLRVITEKDLPLILSWRNAPEVRRNMYTSHEISLEEHTAWFNKNQQDLTAKDYIYVEHNQPMGVINFRNYNKRSGKVFWGFYSCGNAPKGTGLKMEYDALALAFNELDVHKLNCEVLDFNKAVIYMHKKVGFKEEGFFRDFHFDGTNYHNVIRLGMLHSEWKKCEPKLLARIVTGKWPL